MAAFKTAMAVVFLAAAAANAQIAPENPDWRESAVPPPPSFDPDHLIRLESPPGSSLNFGIDPATLSISPEGIVRYVVIAFRPGGARNVMYEGIRCATGQYRLYARYNAEGGWSMARDGDWQSLFESPAVRHALTFARAGACTGHSAGRSAEDIARALRAGRSPGQE